MSAFLSGLSDRNASVRKSYSSALGQLVKVNLGSNSLICLHIVTVFIKNDLKVFIKNISCVVSWYRTS